MQSESQSPTSERSYVAFISYRHKDLDRQAAVRIQKKIENYVVPKEYRDKVGGKKLGVCFRDEDELPASSSLSDSITYALDHTQFLIVICTPDLPKSRWCLQEINYFLKTHDRDHVLAVLVDGTPEESFPEQLRFTYDDEGRELAEVEPLAANIAGENHTINRKVFNKEVVRLFAAIIGCPFDALWQRERRAKTNRLIAAMGVGLSAMAVVIGIVLSKNAQISEQNAQILEQNDQIKQQVEQISEQKDQISEQNDEITEQNTKLQQQMSSVLVDSGMSQLEAFDRKTALKNALEALESNDPEIYDHRAEALIASALGTYACEVYHSTRLCEQNTAVTQMTASEDGSLLFTTDAFGTVRAFDVESGDQVWETPFGKTDSLRLYPISAHGLLICKTYEKCVALSMKDGSTVWDAYCQTSSVFQCLSEDKSIFVIMDRGTNNPADDSAALCFLDTATGSVLQKIAIPTDGFYVRTSTITDYYYEYAGDFTSDNSQFACLLPVVDDDENAETKYYSVIFSVDLKEGSMRRIGSFSASPDMVLSLECYEPGNSVYCAVTRTHSLHTGIFPLDGGEILGENYDYSLSSRSGFSSYDYMLKELPYLPPLNNEELSVMFSRNVIYLMNLKDGTMRNTLNLDSAIVCAEWVDKEEEIFQIFTESGWCIQYNVSHYDNKALESLHGEDTPVKSVRTAALIRGGSYINPADGLTVMTSEDVPGRILVTQVVSDAGLQELTGRKGTDQVSYVTISPSGKQLMVFSRNETSSIFVDRYDFSTGAWSPAAELPVYISMSDFKEKVLFPDDDHIIYDGTLYGMDGSVKELDTDFPERAMFMRPSSLLLSDGSVLTTCESCADFGGYRLKEISVLSCKRDGVLLEDCETLEDGLAVQNGDLHPHLYAAGKNGWIASWGNLAYLDEKHIQKATSDPVIAVKNLETGEKFVLEGAHTDVAVSQLILSNTKPLLLAMYQTGEIQLFDLSQGGRTVLEHEYAYGEIRSAVFSDKDSYLLVLTEMNWLDCFDTAAGALLYSEADGIPKKDGSAIGMLHALEMPDDQRMIAWTELDYEVNGACAILDTDAWARMESNLTFLGFSKESRTVVLGNSSRIFTCPYYTLEDLAEQARDRLK